MKTKALSRLAAVGIAPYLSIPHIIISIGEPNGQPIEFKENKQRLAVLSLNFYDLDYNPKGWGESAAREVVKQYGFGMFKVWQADKIIDFVEQWKDKAKACVVHCEAGVSRSAGVAAAIELVLNGSDKVIFDDPRYIPNRYIYRILLKRWQGRR